MDNAFSRLAKVIGLERKQGYRNKAVIGGVDKFASRWEADARAETADQAAVTEIVALLIGYSAMTDSASRERIIEQVVRRLHDVSPGAAAGAAPGAEQAGAPATPARPAPPARGAAVAPSEAPAEGAGKPFARPMPRQRPAESRPLPTRPAPNVPARPGPAAPEIAEPAPSSGGPAAAASSAAPEPDLNLEEWGLPSAPTLAPAPAAGPAGPLAEPRVGEAGKTESAAEPAQQAARPPISKPAPARSKPERTPLAGQTPQAQPKPRPEQEPVLTPDPPPALAPDQLVARDADDLSAPGQEGQEDHRDDEGGQGDYGGPGDQGYQDHEGYVDNGGNEGYEGNERELASAPDWAPSRQLRAAGGGAEGAPPQPGSRGLDAPVTRLPGVGPSFAEKLAKIGVQSVRDLLYLLPRRYDDFSALRTIDKLRYGEEVTVIGTIWDVKSRTIGENRKLTTAVVGDGTGELQVTWFNPFVERQLHIGHAFVFSGTIDNFRGRLVMSNPEFETLDREQVSTGRLVPVYPLTAGLSGRWLRKIMNLAVNQWAAAMPDFLPERIRKSADLLSRSAALAQIHFPDSHDSLAAAHRRLSFDEFLVLQLGVLSNRQRFRGTPARTLCADENVLAPFLNSLPFSLTGAQRQALAEIAADLTQTQPMGRLLQGDVGSGKTAVAAAALWAAVADGAQGAIMAPTEILAEQHARSLEKMFAGLARPGTDHPVRIGLLTGRQRKAERDETLAALAAGEIDIAVGTHALIQDEVTFRDLALAVVDEQHRFGVEQRAALRQKGIQPHMLVMSATPIPRSLALTIYGDLDVSVINEMPAGRTPIRTRWMTSTQRERAYDFIRRQIATGRQAFIIYPLVESSEQSEAKAAVDEHARLKKDIFPDLRLGLLHGRLRGEEKDAVMRAFAAGELDILVATSVVEVGIDVPNATVIMIEGAERFGLAQLHQFRGRVGRGEYQSYCILISDAGAGDSAQRLQALETSNDGFALAQTDLDMRGPGDFFGTRQSGLPPLQMAQLSDLRTLEAARAAAQELFAVDPQLSRPEHRALAAQVAEFWHGAGDAS